MPNNIIMADQQCVSTFKKITEAAITAQNSVDLSVPSNVASKCSLYVIFCDVTMSEASKIQGYVNASNSSNNRIITTASNAASYACGFYAAVFPSATNGSISLDASIIGQSSVNTSGQRTTNTPVSKFVFVSSVSGSTMSGNFELWGWY